MNSLNRTNHKALYKKTPEKRKKKKSETETVKEKYRTKKKNRNSLKKKKNEPQREWVEEESKPFVNIGLMGLIDFWESESERVRVLCLCFQCCFWERVCPCKQRQSRLFIASSLWVCVGPLVTCVVWGLVQGN